MAGPLPGDGGRGPARYVQYGQASSSDAAAIAARLYLCAHSARRRTITMCAASGTTSDEAHQMHEGDGHHGGKRHAQAEGRA